VLPNLGLSTYVDLARETARIATENCVACKKADSQEQYRKAKKDGRRNLRVIHSLATQVAEPDSLLDEPGSGLAEVLSRVAKTQSHGMMPLPATQTERDRIWLVDSQSNERQETVSPALAIISERQLAVAQLQFAKLPSE